MKVLIDVYACEPFRGSEPGVGWNWISYLSNHCEIIAITTKEHEPFIKKGLHTLKKPRNVKFIYFDISEKMSLRTLRMHRLVHHHFWQKALIKYLLKKNISVDLVHHVTYNGYREADYLWKLNKPYVWGPIGGAQSSKFLWTGIWHTSIFFEFARDIFNFLTLKFSSKIQNALKHAKLVFVADSTTLKKLPLKYSQKYVSFLETGISEEMIIKRNYSLQRKKPIKVLWSGLLIPRKAVIILLRVAKHFDSEVKFIVVGDGSKRKYYEKYVRKNNILNVTFKGKVSYLEMQEIYKTADLFLFTSLRDTSGNVVLEAMAKGLPSIVLNHHGAGDIVGENGLRVDVNSIPQIVNDIAQIIRDRIDCKPYFKDVVTYQYERLENEYLWDKKAKIMFDYYKKVLKENNK